MNPLVDNYLAEGCGRCSLGGTPACKVHTWKKELPRLRKLALQCGLTEEIKWSVPCYTFDGKNVLLLHAFRDYCAIAFFKGVLLKDPQQILTSPGENSQSSRMVRFTDVKQIKRLESELVAYIIEAIELERAGKKVEFKAKHELEYPQELLEKFQEHPTLEQAFTSLTPGRQRGYVLHFTAAKQSKTRHARIEKCLDQIYQGKGLHD